MNATTQIVKMSAEQNAQISETIRKERSRLFNFIRKRVPNDEDAEDILQDVFFQLVETYRLMKPIEQVSAWLFTVARNKITDMFRKKKALTFTSQERPQTDEGESFFLQDLLLTSEGGPEDDLARRIIMQALEDALETLPQEQKDVFIQHEIEGMSFKEISKKEGTGINTLISRKRYAVLSLRGHLEELYEEFITE